MRDKVDELAALVIEAFTEHMKGFYLEQLAVPEDLDDPKEDVELWVMSEEPFVPEGSEWAGPRIHAHVSVPVVLMEDKDAVQLAQMFAEAISSSRDYRAARRRAGLIGGMDPTLIPSSLEEAEMN